MRTTTLAALLAATLAAAPALGQSMNLRSGPFAPVPSSSFGAATGQSGVWNAVEHQFSYNQQGGITELVDLAGQATDATAFSFGCDVSTCQPGLGGDLDALFGSFVNNDCYADPNTTFVDGLEPGHYVLTVYGTSCTPTPHGVWASLSDGSFSGSGTLAGSYGTSFDDMTLGRFEFDLAAGATLEVSAGNFGAMCAMQLTRVAPLVTYCTSKVNSQGCAAKIAATTGTYASVSGATPFVLGATDVVTDTAGLFFYGFGRDIKPFKGGFHCVQAPTPRTPVQFSGGTAGVNCSGSFWIDFNSYLQTPVAANVEPGMTLDGQYWYRDPNDPAGFDSATSDAIEFGVAP